MHETVLPPGWPKPKGYAHGVVARGRQIYLGGQIGWTSDQVFESLDFPGQVRQTLKNIVSVLEAAGAAPHHLVRLTWYVVDKKLYLDNIGAVGTAYREVLGKHFPAMAVVQVGALVEDQALVEIEATAVVPEEPKDDGDLSGA